MWWGVAQHFKKKLTVSILNCSEYTSLVCGVRYIWYSDTSCAVWCSGFGNTATPAMQDCYSCVDVGLQLGMLNLVVVLGILRRLFIWGPLPFRSMCGDDMHSEFNASTHIGYFEMPACDYCDWGCQDGLCSLKCSVNLHAWARDKPRYGTVSGAAMFYLWHVAATVIFKSSVIAYCCKAFK